MLRLEFPGESHKEKWEEMIAEWKKYENIPTSPTALFQGETYETFLGNVNMDLLHPIEGRVPATLFFIFENERLLGGFHIRHTLETPFLEKIGGHIGYGIRPSERKKGYGSQALKLGLIEVKRLGIHKVMIGCYETNIASHKIIEKNGGIFERYEDFDGKKARIYYISL